MRSEFIGPYGKFSYENTPHDWFSDLEDGVRKMLERKTTYSRKKWNERIFNKWNDTYHEFLKMAAREPKDMLDGPITWYHNQCLASPTLFALSYTLSDNGFPMFLAPWQYEFLLEVEKYDDIAGLMSRKLGKSEVMKVVVLKKMVKPKSIGAIEHVRIFAPKERQLFLRDRINRMLRRSQFFQEEFIMEKSEDKYTRGRFSDTYLEFGRNGSTMIGAGLAMTSSGGRSATGEAGTFFVLDEFGQVEQKAIDIAITPMLLDAYSDKTLARLGTPTRDVNPDMKTYWLRLVADPEVRTFAYDWVYGVKTGCIPQEAMRKVARDKGINCPFLMSWGICGPEFVGEDVRIDTETGFLTYPHEEGYANCWSCDECCKRDGTFVEEYCADFSEFGGGYWPLSMIERSFSNDYTFWKGVVPKNYAPKLVVAADLGMMYSYCQALVGELFGNRLIVRDWKEIEPLNKSGEKFDVEKGNIIFKKLADFFEPYSEFIKGYYIDITGEKLGTLSQAMVNYFPKHKIYRNETSKEKGYWGVYIGNDAYNTELKENLRTCFEIPEMITLPNDDKFRTNIMWEFENCQIKRTPNGLKFGEPKSGRRTIDLIDTLSMLVIPIDARIRRSRPLFQVGAVRDGKVYVAGGKSYGITR